MHRLINFWSALPPWLRWVFAILALVLGFMWEDGLTLGVGMMFLVFNLFFGDDD
ncbi:DUF4175 domain-containing protein [Myxococcota bacterium]|nr:DUF4175 domain-containing protein [Myxococcota bacterium]MBU1430073.1 DUF4175 domain-containing protein [Myxococcota bacterium]MBU1900100.1 DUF4175 domain-containing protein [Myxococcota bacterium]